MARVRPLTAAAPTPATATAEAGQGEAGHLPDNPANLTRGALTMTSATYKNLLSFEHDINALRQICPDAVPHDDRDRRTPLTPAGCGWEAVNDALDMLEAVPFYPNADTPPAWSRWLRLAALDALRAATACAGLGDDDAPRWERMTVAGLVDECYQVVHPA